MNPLQSVVAFYGTPIDGIGVLSIGDFDLRAYISDERSRCAEAALLLFIGAVAKIGILTPLNTR